MQRSQRRRAFRPSDASDYDRSADRNDSFFPGDNLQRGADPECVERDLARSSKAFWEEQRPPHYESKL